MQVSNPTSEVGAGGELSAAQEAALASVGSLTAGSVCFANASGVLSQSNANFYFDPTSFFLRLGAGANAGELRFLEGSGGGTNYTGFKAPATLAGNVMYTMPSADGSANTVLKTNGSGTLSWSTVTENSGALAGVTSLNMTGAITGATTGAFTAASSLTLGTASSAAGGIIFNNATNANTLTIQSGVTSASYALTLPTAQGGAGTYLKNDGAGALSWDTPTGFSWGSSISGTTSPGVLITQSDSSAAAAIGISQVMGDTQGNSLIGHKINLGSASVSHTGLSIVMNGGTNTGGRVGITLGTIQDGASGTKTGLNIDNVTAGAGTAYGMYIDRVVSGDTGTGAGLYINNVANGNSVAAYGVYMGTVGGPYSGGNKSYGWYVAALNSAGAGDRSKYFSLNEAASGTGIEARTSSMSEILVSRTETRTSGTTADDFDILNIVRTSVMNGAGGTLTAAGSVLRLENIATQSAGTLTDTTAVLELAQGALTSTNFKKLIVLAGVTLWISDGTTANGNLSGTAGDICFNAGTNKPEYCTGTTNWTALV